MSSSEQVARARRYIQSRYGQEEFRAYDDGPLITRPLRGSYAGMPRSKLCAFAAAVVFLIGTLIAFGVPSIGGATVLGIFGIGFILLALAIAL